MNQSCFLVLDFDLVPKKNEGFDFPKQYRSLYINGRPQINCTFLSTRLYHVWPLGRPASYPTGTGI